MMWLRRARFVSLILFLIKCFAISLLLDVVQELNNFLINTMFHC